MIKKVSKIFSIYYQQVAADPGTDGDKAAGTMYSSFCKMYYFS